MLPEIRKILYATDLSSNANHAFGYAASLANKCGAVITVLTVLKDTCSSHDMSVIDLFRKGDTSTIGEVNKQEIMRHVKTHLDELRRGTEKKLPPCSSLVDKIIVETGEPADAILAWVENSGCDMVVIGSRGLGMVMNALMGSTSRRVVRRCPKPVLVVRLPEDAQI